MAKEKKKRNNIERRGRGTAGGSGILREFSSGGVVYRKQNDQIYWLITHSNPSKDYPFDVWRLPKGWIDDDGDMPGPVASGKVRATEQQLQSAALREVSEEGGEEAKIIQKIGNEMFVFNSRLRKTRVMKFVTFYLMEWVGDVPSGHNGETSEISWLPYVEARKKLTHLGEKKILDKAKKLLDSGTQQSLV